MAHFSETDIASESSRMQGDAEPDLDNSLFQLPIRRCRTQTLDNSKEIDGTELAGSIAEDADLQESWHVLRPTVEATKDYTEPISSHPADQLRLTDMAFQRLACGDFELLEAYLDAGALIEHENHNGLTLLVTAIKDSNVAMTRLLLQKGANAQHRAQRKPPLIHAAQSKEHGPMLVRLLLDNGANVNTICGMQRMNALHWAAAAGMVDTADYLISRGLDIEATCAGGHTALHVAAGTGHLIVVKLLLAQGAELAKKGELGGNAMTFAASMGHLDIVKLCMEEGLHVDNCNDKGLTALMSACEAGHDQVVRYLVEKGANVNKVDTQQSTPVLEAAAKGHMEIVRALITAGADLGFRDAGGQNTLEVALSKGYMDVVRLILTTLGDPDYPLESVSLEIASARRLETTRSLMKSASLMHEHFEPRSEMSQEYAWVKWVLDTGGEHVKPKAMSNMTLVAISEANVGLVEALLSNGADVNEFPLGTFVVNQNLDIVQLLLNHGACPTVSARCIKCPNGLQDNLLIEALLNMPYQERTCLAILKLLLDSGRFNILSGSTSNQTAFWRVLESDDWNPEVRNRVAFTMLDSVADVNCACNGDSGTLMHHVVRYGCKDMVDYLLKKGANINAQDAEGRTPIIVACDYQANMISFLLERGASFSLHFEDGKGPLHAAAIVGNIEALEVLWTQGSMVQNLDHRSMGDWTPLACALAADQEEAALFLIRCGADLKHIVTANGRTMLHLAAAFGHEQVFGKIVELGGIDINAKDTIKDSTPLLLACAGTRYRAGSMRIVRALLSAGADIETAGSHLDRPLHVAITTGNTAIAETLIGQGAKITTTGSKGRTPLHLAAEYENPDIMRLLLRKGAATEVIDDSGWTPLHLCIDSLTAQILIDHGAHTDHIDRNGLTPLHHAVLYGDIELFTTLLGNGASTQTRTTVDGRNAMDMIEDLGDVRLRDGFLAAQREAPSQHERPPRKKN